MKDTQANIARGGMPPADEIRRRIQLPFRNAVRIAWRNLRVRLGRSLLVTAGIVLALAFLTFVLCSDAILGQVVASAPRELVEHLRSDGKLADIADSDARIQTRWLAGLALLVSFVGILNAMLLSVTERYGEIGTMKCLGALDGLVVKLFLLESLFQGLVGTSAGVLLGLALALGQGVSTCGWAVWRWLPPGRLAATCGVCLAAGMGLTVAGALYPAWRAARMQPVEAMRTEV